MSPEVPDVASADQACSPVTIAMSGEQVSDSAGDDESAPNLRAYETVALPLVFKGRARDYFRLWIVNLCLTLFTLGIFSAWAKVRRKRYFYSHTELAGTPFEYLGQPLPILKGRVVAWILLALWYVGTRFVPELLWLVGGAGLLLLPWMLLRTLAFNARYSAYRNMTFDFSGHYWRAATTLLVSTLLTLATCGLGYPWALTRARRYFVERTSFGGIDATYAARGGDLIGPYLVIVSAISAMVIFGLASLKAGAHVGRFMTPALAVFYVVYGGCYVYFGTRVAQVNWRRTALGPLRFRADYRARDFAWLHLTNVLASVCSLGLLIPWAAVRLHRYRVERLTVLRLGDLDEFEGQPARSVQATGAEVADLFDFDLSL